MTELVTGKYRLVINNNIYEYEFVRIKLQALVNEG